MSKEYKDIKKHIDIKEYGDLNAYYFYFENWLGTWANFYVDNAKGTFMINSDWGDFTYRWGLSGMPENKSFEQFLADCVKSCDYVTTKFSYGRDDARRFCGTHTSNRIKRDILDLRREGAISAEQARCAWLILEDASQYDNDIEYNSLVSSCFEDTDAYFNSDEFVGIEDLFGFNDFKLSEIIEDIWEYYDRIETPKFRFVRQELLPMFFGFLKDHLEQRDKKAS